MSISLIYLLLMTYLILNFGIGNADYITLAKISLITLLAGAVVCFCWLPTLLILVLILWSTWGIEIEEDLEQ